jgi:putative NADPH-quinone reductase
MRILVLYAHPVETSFGAAVHACAVAALKARGHAVDDCDLNAEGFNPVMSRQDRLDYHDVSINRARVGAYVDRLLAAEALVLSFPVWNMGFPAILKGFVDKVFLPGVSFVLHDNGDYSPSLHNIKRLGAVCTYGGARWRTFLMGDPPRRVVKRTMRANIAPGAPCDYLAHYDMNHTNPERRAAFLKEVEARFSRW